MTRKDFELVADAIATVEADYKGLHRQVIQEIVDEISKRIAAGHPRFKPGLFDAACMPTKHDELRDAVLESLGMKGAA